MCKLWHSLAALYRSSIGKKLVVALTGIALLLFLAGHLAGNLLIFAGREAINEYAVWLHGLGHGAGIWVARIGLLGCFVAHIVTTILLVLQNRAARESRYEKPTTVQASSGSRFMMVSGSIILAFVVFHILHYTVGVAMGFKDVDGPYALGDGHWDVYQMLVDGFKVWYVSVFYMISIGLLCWHLSHGFASVFQTLGLRTDRSWPLIKAAGYGYAAIIFLGNLSIPLSILFGIVGK